MQERPLLLTALGWIYLITGAITLLVLPFEEQETPNAGWVPSPAILLASLMAIYLAGVIGAIMALLGKKHGRVLLLGALCLEFAYTLGTERLDVNPFVLIDVLAITLTAFACYGTRGRAFFNQNLERPRLTYQLGTAVCYFLVIFLLTSAMIGIAAWSELRHRNVYLSVICLALAALVFSTGRHYGCMPNPRRAAGNLLVLSGILSGVLSLSIYVHNAGGFQAISVDGDAEPNVSLWVAGVTAAVSGGLGVALLKTSGETPAEPNRAEPLEDAP